MMRFQIRRSKTEIIIPFQSMLRRINQMKFSIISIYFLGFFVCFNETIGQKVCQQKKRVLGKSLIFSFGRFQKRLYTVLLIALTNQKNIVVLRNQVVFQSL